jgi:hypothetical protein
MVPTIGVELRYIQTSESSLPGLALQITRLVDSYMLWIGTTEEPADVVHKAPLGGNLTRDWACAMPPTRVRHPHMMQEYAFFIEKIGPPGWNPGDSGVPFSVTQLRCGSIYGTTSG